MVVRRILQGGRLAAPEPGLAPARPGWTPDDVGVCVVARAHVTRRGTRRDPARGITLDVRIREQANTRFLLATVMSMALLSIERCCRGQLRREARRAGLDVIAVTNHKAVWRRLSAASPWLGAFGLRLFSFRKPGSDRSKRPGPGYTFGKHSR